MNFFQIYKNELFLRAFHEAAQEEDQQQMDYDMGNF